MKRVISLLGAGLAFLASQDTMAQFDELPVSQSASPVAVKLDMESMPQKITVSSSSAYYPLNTSIDSEVHRQLQPINTQLYGKDRFIHWDEVSKETNYRIYNTGLFNPGGRLRTPTPMRR